MPSTLTSCTPDPITLPTTSCLIGLHHATDELRAPACTTQPTTPCALPGLHAAAGRCTGLHNTAREDLPRTGLYDTAGEGLR